MSAIAAMRWMQATVERLAAPVAAAYRARFALGDIGLGGDDGASAVRRRAARATTP